MYRVMIIDDEKSIRGLLRTAIRWESLGFEVVGEAESGIEGINIIDDLRPDIVFVDIKMPFMDGIAFSKLAIQRYPHLKIIVLTAFDEFEYARRCIGIGVSEFILKPINTQEITQILAGITETLNLESKNQTDESLVFFHNETTVDRIKEYLCRNYTDAKLNLTSTAHFFGFNSSYLSRLFKADAGVSFSDYLFACRMEKAVELAKNRVLLYRAAEAVGIPDPNYFGRCFKKHTGVNYSDFITRVAKKEKTEDE